MLRSYFTVAWRALRRQPGYAFINIFGLAIGIACFVLIVRYVQDELAYDQHHTNADRIYRVVEIIEGAEESASQPLPVGETIRTDHDAQVEASVRFFNLQQPTVTFEYRPPTDGLVGADSAAAVQAGLIRHNETRFFFADSSLFDVFDVELLAGDPSRALTEPNTLLLTPAMAAKYFGDADPIGQTLTFEGQGQFEVTGVVAPQPDQSHIQYDILGAFVTLNQWMGPNLTDNYYWNPAWTYVLLREGVEPEALEVQFPAYVDRYFPDFIKADVRLYLQPLTDIHLRSALDFEMAPNSDIAYVYIFSAIAVFVLLIACINFMNLATARSAQRAKEVGMRKVLGAERSQLMSQFLGESILTTLAALVLAVPLILFLLPFLNELAGKSLSVNPLEHPTVPLSLLIVVLVVGVLSGLYPALFLSGFRPARVLKGDLRVGNLKASAVLRKGLVVAQFALSIALLVGTFVAFQQLGYLQSKNLGFEEEQVVLVPTQRSPIIQQYEAFRSALQQHPGVLAVTATEDVPGSKYQTNSYGLDGQEDRVQFPRLLVHDEVVEALDLELVAGRGFSQDFGTDSTAVMVNEAMVRHLGWASPQDALGRTFDDRTVIGVTANFHYTSLRTPVGPFVLDRFAADNFGFFGRYLAVRLDAGNPTAALDHIAAQWAAFVPEKPFAYTFLDQSLAQLYRAERALGRVAAGFALFGILVACLGLLGMASFTAEQRTKEIGVRKVLGASVGNLILLLSRESVQLVLVAMVVAWPLAYLGLTRWLDSFAYQTSLGPLPFVAAGLIVLGVAFGTVSLQARRAATTDPVAAIRRGE
ncbi:MAG: FtsX-like permease family protein [Bacteroidota bacterium]